MEPTQKETRTAAYLNDGSLAGNFEDLTFTDGTITQDDVNDFSVSKSHKLARKFGNRFTLGI